MKLAPGHIAPGSIVSLLATFLLIAGTPYLSLAATQVRFHWQPSPVVAESGFPLPPAVAYGVWLTEDHKTEYRVATVNDTFYILAAEPGRIYNLRVCGLDAAGNESPKSPLSDDYQAPVATSVTPVVPAGLGSVYPNPFNPRTMISFHVPENLGSGAPLSLAIYDPRGRLVRSFNPDRVPGENSVSWDGRNNQGAAVPAGVYIARYVCGATTSILKMTMLR